MCHEASGTADPQLCRTILATVPDSPSRPGRTHRPAALFVFSSLREQKGGLTVAWLRRLAVFAAAGWDTHVATIHRQPDIDQIVAAWRARGVLPASTCVHQFQERDRRLRTRWSRPDDETFSRDDRVADWLDWLVGRIPGVVVLADSPVAYAPVALMRNPFVGRVMTVHLSHRFGGLRSVSHLPAPESRYSGIPGRPKLQDRLLPFAAAADVVVAPTHRQAEHLRADLPGCDVRTIPNIVDPDALGTTLPGEPPPEHDPLLVVIVGRLEALKRLDDALRAFALVVAQVPGARLEVHGLGPDLQRLLALRSKLGLDDVVSFPGFTDRPGRVLAGAALSVLTSAREAFGLSVAESLAVGTPVVCYDIDYGPGELVVDGVNGRLVADGSVEGLAATIVELLTDPATLARMRADAPTSVARLRPAEVGRCWLDLAAEVASRVALPDGALLVEGVRLRRRGLVLSGVVVGTDPAAAPVRVGIDGPDPGPGGPEAAGTVVVGQPSPDGDASAVLPWSHVGRWLIGTALRAWAADGREVPVLGPCVPRTVVPTEQGLKVLGASEAGGLVALDPGAELGGDPLVLVRARTTTARVLVDGEATIVTEILRARGTLLPGGAGAARVEVTTDLPGVGLEDGATLALAAKVADALVAVGTVGPMSGRWERPDGSPAHWRGVGDVAWDAEALAALAGPDSPVAALPLSLAIGRTPRAVGPVTAARGSSARPVAGGPWRAVGGPSGRALLIRGEPGGVRAVTSSVRRRLRGARRRVEARLGRRGGVDRSGGA